MRSPSTSSFRLPILLACLFWSGAAWAQSPTITSIVPTANATAANRSGAVTAIFTQALTSNSAGALKVFSAQRGGLRTTLTPAVVNANALVFTPPQARSFLPGETIFGTVTTAASSTNGNLSIPRVFQFTAAVGATGTGAYQAPLTNPNPAVAPNARAVALGDLDGDGDLDFACSYEDANYNGFVSVRLNNGAGNFTAPATGATIAIGGGNLTPVALVMGDVDGDGDLDLVTANHNGGTASILLNDGSAHFTPPAVNPNPVVGNYASQVALGDIDGDGDLDLLSAVVASQTGAGVTVRLNNGTGNFTAPAGPAAEVLTNGSTYGVVVGDLDGDSDLDLVAANEYANTVIIRLNDGAGNFSAPAATPDITVGTQPYKVVLGDFDADGDLDFVTANYYGTASVRLNNGTGGFSAGTTPELSLGRATSSVATSDVDGDGDLDLLTSDLYDAVVQVRLNDGRGNFSVPNAFTGSVAVGTVPKSLVTGDIDGDGDLDLLTAVGGGVSVRLNYVPLIVTRMQPAANALAAPRHSPVVATFNQPLGSGASGLQVHSRLRGGLRTSTVPAIMNGNTLTYTPPATQPYLPGETIQCTVTPAAVPGTGQLGHSNVTQFGVAVGGTGTGRFLSPPVAANATLPMGSRVIAGMTAGDIDGDGDLDLLAVTGINTVTIRLNDGRGIFATPITGATLTIANTHSPNLVDIDGDGDLDLLTGCTDASGVNCVSISLNYGNGTFAPPAYTFLYGSLSSIDFGDLDGNGTLDFVATHTGSYNDYVSIYLNNGNGTFTSSYPNYGGVLMPPSPGGIKLGDIDRDGDLDFLVRCDAPASSSNGIAVRFNDGFGRFSSSPGAPFIAVGSPIGFTLADVDGDGDLDLLSMDNNNGYITVLLNNGNGLFTARSSTSALYTSNFTGMKLGDVDADGDLDLLVLTGTPHNTTYNGIVRELLNDGLGNFTVPPATSQASSVQVDKYPRELVMEDVDGDGDLDVLTSGGINVSYGGTAATISVRLNGGTVLAAATPHLVTSMYLYPNPATGEFKVSGASLGLPLEVFDLMGRRVMSTEVITQETALVALPPHLAPGIYTVRSGAQSQRLAVQ